MQIETSELIVFPFKEDVGVFNPENLPLPKSLTIHPIISNEHKCMLFFFGIKQAPIPNSIDLIDKWINSVYQKYDIQDLLSRLQLLLYMQHLAFSAMEWDKISEKDNRLPSEEAISVLIHYDFELLCLPIIISNKYLRGKDVFLYDNNYINSFLNMYKLGKTDIPITIFGETGTGKESAALFIHDSSERKNKHFEVINAASISNQGILLCELFGNTKGAYTGADKENEGIIKHADGGTVFFDEIGATNLEFQQALLRFLETGEFKKVGGVKTERADCRFIFATSQNLEKMMDEGRLLPDFYYRIKGATIVLPPLRSILNSFQMAYKLCQFFVFRVGNPPELEQHEIIKRIETATNDFQLWLSYEWKGNFREFYNYFRRNLVLDQWADLPSNKKEPPRITLPTEDYEDFEIVPFVEIERRYLSALLKKNDWNRKKSAEISGLSESTIKRKIQQFKLHP